MTHTKNANGTMIHVRTWAGTGSVRITDMADAYRRGRKCRTITFNGWMPTGDAEPYASARALTADTVIWAERLDPATPFDTVVAELRRRVADAGLPEHACRVYEDDIRAVDAPRPVLSARLEGKWSAGADESGITINDEVDQNNLPCMITPHSQTGARAYELAAKVWDRVQAAESFSEVGDVLSSAGCKLHYYCRMD